MAAGYAATNAPWTVVPQIGDHQYTVGFNELHTQSVYACDIDAASGTSATFNTYEVNNTPVFQSTHIPEVMAVTNSTNQGDDILTVWSTSKKLLYKYSTPNVMAFRTPGGKSNCKGLETEPAIYAEPSSDVLRLRRVPIGADYQVMDANGKVHLSGTTDFRYTVDAANLPNGNYSLRISQPGKAVRSFSFSKQ